MTKITTIVALCFCSLPVFAATPSDAVSRALASGPYAVLATPAPSAAEVYLEYAGAGDMETMSHNERNALLRAFEGRDAGNRHVTYTNDVPLAIVGGGLNMKGKANATQIVHLRNGDLELR